MSDAKEFVERRMRGQPAIYNPEKHLELMYEVFNKGKDVSRFCKEAEIGRTTFYNWLKKYKEFRECYEILINYAESYWQDKSESADINPSIWFHVMKTRFNPFKDYNKKACFKELLKCETFGKMLRHMISKVALGELTTEEGNSWMDLIGRAVKVEDVSILIERVMKLENSLRMKQNEI